MPYNYEIRMSPSVSQAGEEENQWVLTTSNAFQPQEEEVLAKGTAPTFTQAIAQIIQGLVTAYQADLETETPNPEDQ